MACRHDTHGHRPESPALGHRLGRWLTFNAVGAAGMGVQLLALVALTDGWRLDYRLATALAVEVSILHNFAWHERWTWRDRCQTGGRLRRLAAFNAANGLLSIGGNVVLTTWLVVSLGIHYVVANIVAVAACSIVTFLANDRLVFRSSPRSDSSTGSSGPPLPLSCPSAPTLS